MGRTKISNYEHLSVATTSKNRSLKSQEQSKHDACVCRVFVHVCVHVRVGLGAFPGEKQHLHHSIHPRKEHTQI